MTPEAQELLATLRVPILARKPKRWRGAWLRTVYREEKSGRWSVSHGGELPTRKTFSTSIVLELEGLGYLRCSLPGNLYELAPTGFFGLLSGEQLKAALAYCGDDTYRP